MKNIIFALFVFALLTVSCGKDDGGEVSKPLVDSVEKEGDTKNEAPIVDSIEKEEDTKNEAPKQNPFIGRWEVESITVNGRERVLSDCEKKSYAVFEETTLKTHIGVLAQGICVEQLMNWTYTVSEDKIHGKSDKGLVAEIPFSFNEEVLTLIFVFGNRKLVGTYRKR